MQILVAVNTEPHSLHAVDQVARLAFNTIAKVTILGVDAHESARLKPSAAPGDQKPGDPLQRAVNDYRDRIFDHFSRVSHTAPGPALEPPGVRVRKGSPSKEILAESREQGSNLIVLGCNQEKGCTWNKGQQVPRQIAGEADCSVYIAKKTGAVDRVVCCLGHEEISQQSLEMVSQFVTLNNCRLMVVGLLEHGALKSGIEKKLGWLISYYAAKNIESWVEVVEAGKFDAFVANEASYALMSFWMGKESLLSRIFSKTKLNRLLKASETSVLVLR